MSTPLVVWRLVAVIFLNLLATAESSYQEGTDLYKTVQQEKQRMMILISMRPGIQKSCRNSCGKIVSTRDPDECHCDRKCAAVGDCCLDYWESCNSSFTEAYHQRRIFECFTPILLLSNTTRNKEKRILGYEVVTKCPLTFQNLRIKNACEKPELENEKVLPFVEGNDGTTYRNQHCAECNNILEYKHWNTSFICPNRTQDFVTKKLREKVFIFTSEERKLIRDTCVIEMRPPSGHQGTPCRTTVRECENVKSSDYLKCKVYKQQIYRKFLPFKIFKNPHCARCNGEPTFMLSDTNRMQGGQEGHSSLGLLFDFRKSSQIFGLKEIQTTHECEPGEVYDYQLKACRQKLISKASVFKNWTCVFANETFPNSSTYISIFKNQSIYVMSHNKIYRPGSYRWHEGNVTVCGNLTTSYLKTIIEKLSNLYTKGESLITAIGLTLSIIALLTVIITYFLFSELRSKLPGKIVINLATALMFAQLVFLYDMFADVTGPGCVVIAVLLQFLYLAAFCWMNVMAFDVSRTFAGKSHRSPSGSRNKVFILCLIYAWGLPLFITTLTLIINHTGAMNVAYGNNYFCWITNPVAKIIFFVVPVVLMLLFNIVALVRVLIAVRRVRKVTKKVRDKSTAGQDARMCWKLTAVFGLTWILCLAADYHIVLRIVYIIFNSLQGVFIMVGFIMTKRVLNMYLKKAGREPLSTSQTAGSTQKSTLSRSEVTRKTSSAPLVDRKPVEKRREKPEQAVEVMNDEDSPESELIKSMEGPETKL